MIKISTLFFTTFLIFSSCDKESNNIPTAPNSSNNTSSILEKSYVPINDNTGNNFAVYGPPCWTNSPAIAWCCSGNNKAEIFSQNGIYWIDSMNYVIREKVPITLLNNASFTFNDYITENGFYHILGGTAYLFNDTLTFTANAKTGPQNPGTNVCNFTFKGKYRASL